MKDSRIVKAIVINRRTYRTAHTAAMAYAGSIALRLFYSANHYHRDYHTIAAVAYRRLHPIMKRLLA